MLMERQEALSSKQTFEAYKLYLALTRHFNSKSYDYFKYNGQVKAHFNSFLKRKDKAYFHKLAKHKDPKGLLIANLVDSDKVYVANLVTDSECEKVYLDWVRRKEARSHIFKEELKKLDDDYMSNLKVKKDGGFPPLLKKLIRKDVSLETVMIMNDLTPFFSHWDEKISPKLMWEHISSKSIKYYPFLSYDRKRMKKILIERFK